MNPREVQDNVSYARCYNTDHQMELVKVVSFRKTIDSLFISIISCCHYP